MASPAKVLAFLKGILTLKIRQNLHDVHHCSTYTQQMQLGFTIVGEEQLVGHRTLAVDNVLSLIHI